MYPDAPLMGTGISLGGWVKQKLYAVHIPFPLFISVKKLRLLFTTAASSVFRNRS